MKIITLSEPDCGGKPTGYCAVVESEGKIALAAHVKNALVDVWRYGEGVADHAVSGDVMSGLKERGFAWIDERILVELTKVDKYDYEKSRSLDAEMVLVNLDNGMVGVRSTNRDKVDERWAAQVVKDALKFYMM